MNNNGQVVVFTLMVAVCIFILALAFIFPVKEATTNAMAASDTGMNCTSSLITTYTKAACLVSDITLPYFIAAILALGGAIAGAKLLFS